MLSSDTHLFVATPCFGGMVTTRYMQCLMALFNHGRDHGFLVSAEFLNHESLITRGRNTLLTRFLDTPTATHLLFIDADIGFSPVQVWRMLAFDRDVVAGMYPLKLIEWDRHALENVRAGEAALTAPQRYVGTPCTGASLTRDGAFVTAEYAGTGFMMIRREAVLRMTAAYPQTRYRAVHTSARPSTSPNQFALFDCMIDPDTGDYLSEDYTFCHRWRALGGEIWLDTEGELLHIGPYEFYGNPAARFGESGAAA
ncbi:hypothetical protein [Azospirillum sp. TSO22-1]|uniref:hypothetical protein n=1 Tax=Azospirillum sp. TSO22-1 TaxID=716789 RepID=UPI001FFFD3CF|nr:hypothetical protein [Azospirillum sp. TSO22-1]